MIIATYDCLVCDGSWHTRQLENPGICPRCRKALVRGEEDWSHTSIQIQRDALGHERADSISRIRDIESITDARATAPLIRRLILQLRDWWRDPGYNRDLALTHRKLGTIERSLSTLDAIEHSRIPEAQARFRVKLDLDTRAAATEAQQARRRAQQRADGFEDLVREFSRARAEYVVRPQDYKRGNLLDNFVRGKWDQHVAMAFGDGCALCHSSRDRLTLDHFWISKNDGGNFAMLHRMTSSLVSNVIVLCCSCNSAKGERSFETFFSVEQIAEIRAVEQTLTRKMMFDENLCKAATRWYGRHISPLEPRQRRAF
jgi:hypothetical protein